jgi:hypothetical protein
LLAGNVALMLAIVIASLIAGLKIRRAAWDAASDIHFLITMNNAIHWGYAANQIGVLNVYQERIKELGEENLSENAPGRLALDYPPLRLFVVARWEAWTEKHFPHHGKSQPNWRPDYEFTRPMLELNTACELTAAIAMFLLVHYWLRQCSGAPARQWIEPLRCAWPALFSALLLWFSPALIYNAHCYPQWDAWILPPFLLAVYLGMLNQWLIAGLLVGFVAMGKGQILIVIPALMIWQLCMLRLGRVLRLLGIAAHAAWQSNSVSAPLIEAGNLLLAPFGAVLRLIAGIALAIGAFASPWLLSDPRAAHWMECVLLAALVLQTLFFIRGRSQTAWILQASACLVAAVLILWPWFPKPRPDFLSKTLLALIAAAALARLLPRRWAPAWTAAILAGALFACVPLFYITTSAREDAMAWYTIGIEFPTRHWPLLSWRYAMNLGAILNSRFHWQYTSTLDIADYLPFLQNVDAPTIHGCLLALVTLGIPAGVWLIWRARNRNQRIAIGAVVVLLPLLLLPKIPADWISGINGWVQPRRVFPMRFLMITAYVISLLLCGIAMAVHARRKDRNFLFAMVAPWVLMYTLLPQMQNRYLLWGAALSAAAASFSLDGLMLFLLLNAVNVLDTAFDMVWWMRSSNPTGKKWWPLLAPTFPDVSWAVLLIAGIYLYRALRRGNSNDETNAWPA